MLKKHCFSAFLVFVFSLFITLPGFAQSMLSKGAKAPLFSAEASQAGKDFHFSLKKALKKGPVVLYFFPAAYTGGCDLEAHTFAQLKSKFTAAGATIIGVSADGIKRLNSFSSDPNYCSGKFPVASDPKGKIAATYGLKLIPPQSGVKDVRGNLVKHGFIPRTTFVINKKGTIVATFSSKRDHISPDEHVKKALAIVKGL
ncbi:MAG TPA: peroxiredoxin [Balneolaceae bacterium]|nr:peroxiredoxin [Balneolaceae bacterium]